MTADFPIVFALYPGVTQLDFTAPFEVFQSLPGAKCILASVAGGTLQVEGGTMTFANVARLADVPECKLLCVPGGLGALTTLGDSCYLSELRRLAAGAQYVTSVCTGSLLLAAAGLLRGKRAACHWVFRDLLSEFGVTPDDARVVRDGNVITGGGATAGIDMAFAVIAEIAGVDYAETVQLGLEYAPEPPFDSGRPERARPEIVAKIRESISAIRADRADVVRRAVELLNRERP